MGGAALFRIVAGLMSLALAACASAPVARVDSRGAGAADQALKMVGKPYRFGGSTPAKGFDCSGLVQYSFRQAGVALPRDTEQQRRASASIRVSSLRRGDLVFFNEGWRRNSHVGIYLGGGKFVHAPSSGGHVRTESLDSLYWKKHLSEARRV